MPVYTPMKADCSLSGYRIERGRASSHSHWCTVCLYIKDATIKGRVWDLTHEHAWNLLHSPCVYCGYTPESNSRNGIDRFDNKDGYTKKNALACCSVCNLAKRGMSPEAWRQWLLRTADRVNKHREIFETPAR